MTLRAMLVGFVFLLCFMHSTNAMDFFRNSKKRAKNALEKVMGAPEKSKEDKALDLILEKAPTKKSLARARKLIRNGAQISRHTNNDSDNIGLEFQKFLTLMLLLDGQRDEFLAQSIQGLMRTIVEFTPSILTAVDESGNSLVHQAILGRNSPALAFLLSLQDQIESVLVIRNDDDLTPLQLAQRKAEDGGKEEGLIFNQLNEFIEELVRHMNYKSFVVDSASSSIRIATRVYRSVLPENDESKEIATDIGTLSTVGEGDLPHLRSPYEPEPRRLPLNDHSSIKLGHIISNPKIKWLLRLAGTAAVFAAFYGLKEAYQYLFSDVHGDSGQKREL